MGSDQYRTPCKSCVLCAKSEETEVTGALSSKDNISAHQNCLLYASGIYCKNSPTYDDLFGFAVDDVEQELRRGRKLICHLCHERGATAGCDVKRCKRSYHYPCAKEDNAKVIEDNKAGRYVLFCEKHDPDNKKTSLGTSNGASTSGLNLSKRRGSLDSHGRMSDRRESNSSTGSSVSSRKLFPQSSDTSPDDEIQTCIDPMFAPLESDMDDSPPLPQHNSAPVTEDARPCEIVNPSSLGSVFGASTSGLNHSKGDNPGQFNKRIEYDSPASSPETPRRKKKKLSVLHSDDETSTDPVVSPAVPHVGDCTPQLQHNHSTPVNENTRCCEGQNPSSTGGDDDDTDIESDASQNLLASEPYNITVQCTVIPDSGPSIESENSLEPCSPSISIPADVRTSPAAVAAPQPVITNITAPEPKASTTDPVSPGSADPTPHQERSDDGPSNQPGSPDRSSSISDCRVLISPQACDVTADDPAEHFPPEEQFTSFHLPAIANACSVDAMASSESSAATFWTRCNEAGCTEEIFTELLSQLSSLGDRIQSRDASQQDFDVALKVLEASGRLPVIVTQLEQDLKNQEQELQRKIAALRDAKAALGIQSKLVRYSSVE